LATRQENELLTRTGPGTPMGVLLRRYWIPALLSAQLPEADGPPVRVKLMSESLVAFRRSDGTVGLVDERCPHRGASLFFGRNEDNGLRCVYHGWKFDVTGACTDMPSEPAESSFRHKVRLTAYPCVERGGVVWTYMGPPELRPGFPELEWTAVPASHVFLTRHLQECNWFQALEGGFDTSHLAFLHRGDTAFLNREEDKGGITSLPSRYELLPTEFGCAAGAGRDSGRGETRWNVSLFLMPFHKLISRVPATAPIGGHVWVPVDDESCMIYSIEYQPDRPLQDKEIERSRKWLYIHGETLPGSDRSALNKDNDYGIDRRMQKTANYTGITGFGMQDCGIQESMGTIADRTREHLGTSDLQIVKLRRFMLKALKDLESGDALPGLDPRVFRVRSGSFALTEGQSFEDGLAECISIEAGQSA
jgi:phthalate 4,5-dioxygenase